MENSGQSDAALERSALIVATLTSFIGPFMISSVNVALPAIQADLRMDAVQLSWIATAYLLAVAVGLVPAGKIADIHGRKKVFATGIGIYTLGSGAAAFVDSAALLIATRVFQGIGAAMFVTTGMAILTSIFPPKKRGRVIGIYVAAVYIGLSVGPFVGGLLTQHFGWRSIFLVMLPLGFFSFALTLFFLRGEWLGEPGQQLDIGGCLLYASAILALVYGASRLPAMIGIILLISGALLFYLFVRHQLVARFPVFDMQLFAANRTFAFSSLAALLNYSATFAVTFLLSLYLQYIKGLSPQAAGTVLMAQPIMMALLSPIAGRIVGSYRTPPDRDHRHDHHRHRRLAVLDIDAGYRTAPDRRQPDPARHRFCPVQLPQHDRHHGSRRKTPLRTGLRGSGDDAPARPDDQHGDGHRRPGPDHRPPGDHTGKLRPVPPQHPHGLFSLGHALPDRRLFLLAPRVPAWIGIING